MLAAGLDPEELVPQEPARSRNALRHARAVAGEPPTDVASRRRRVDEFTAGLQAAAVLPLLWLKPVGGGWWWSAAGESEELPTFDAGPGTHLQTRVNA